MENKLNIDNLRIFVNALNKLPDEIKNNKVDMRSMFEPVCGTVGCHAGLIYLVADYIPKLKSLYHQNCQYGYSECPYDFSEWANALAEFLRFGSESYLRNWAENNPELWGNEYGFEMFEDGDAFGQDSNNFKHSVIIDHWTGVLKRVEELNDK